MGLESRAERRRVRWFFAGLLVVSALLDIVSALLIQHQTRSQVLETLLPATVTLGGRTGAVMSGLGLLLLAVGIARGKRIAFRLTLIVLVATIAFELIKDLDFEEASLFAWILFGLWWFRHHFDADSHPSRMRWGLAVLALGDPIAPPDRVAIAAREFVSYCDRQDWIAAFYQVDEPQPYRSLGLTLVPIGAEAIVQVDSFDLRGNKRADLRYAVHRCQKSGVRFVFGDAPSVTAEHQEELHGVSGSWLQSHHSPELGYSLGTLTTLSDPDILVGLAFGAEGRLEAFVSWLPVPARQAWTLDLMRPRPASTSGGVEALIGRSIEEARSRGMVEASLGMTPRIITAPSSTHSLESAWRAMYWGLDRFQRSRTLHRFKEKFGPRWEDRFLVVPSTSSVPEVMVALVRAHVPPVSVTATWLRSRLSPRRAGGGRRALA